MKHLKPWCLAVCLMLIGFGSAQGQWEELYATYDDADSNGIGYNSVGVGVIHENMFVALVMTQDVRNYMIPYVNADSAVGRVYSYGYGSATAGIYQVWSDGGFTQIQLKNASAITATPDSLIYVANNDIDHNILVFKYVNDTITVVDPFPCQRTGPIGIFGISVDENGYVYVCNDTSIGVGSDVKIYPPISQWTSVHQDPPSSSIDLPDGIYKGITTSPDGTQLFISDYGNRKILKYTGSPTTGYTLDAGFDFHLAPDDTIAGTTRRQSFLGLSYLKPNNILFAACECWLGAGQTYNFSRIYLLNPNTGALVSPDSAVSVIDVAKWNYDHTGAYNDRGNGKQPGNASGYTSTYDVKFDGNGYLYSQSYYGWTVEKWHYIGTLPTFTSVEEIRGDVPGSFRLEQNYPNPFNPATTIEFSVEKSGSVSLKVFDVLGKEVRSLVDRSLAAGSYKVTFDARDLPSGTYFCVLQAGANRDVRKMLLLK